ncbi:MAG: flagellar hook-basal body complex protein FliE, partial [Desulfobacterales bacterium]
MNDITIQKIEQPQTEPAHSGTLTRLSNPGSFGKMLTDSIDQVNRLQVTADSSINDLAMGKQTDIHRTMVAMEKASISFELLMQIRN